MKCVVCDNYRLGKHKPFKRTKIISSVCTELVLRARFIFSAFVVFVNIWELDELYDAGPKEYSC